MNNNNQLKKFLYDNPDNSGTDSTNGLINFIKYKAEPVIEYSLYVLGISTIILGTIVAITVGIKDKTKKKFSTDETIADMRITMSEFIALGLTFILGAEVVKTFRVPNMYQLIKVTMLVLLRQLITYFLDKDVNRLRKEYPRLNY